MADAAVLLCIFGLVAVLGGGILILLCGVRWTIAMLRDWIDSK